MVATDPKQLLGLIRRLRQDPKAVALTQRRQLGEALEDSFLGADRLLPMRAVGPLARVLAHDDSALVRKKVANVLDRLGKEDFDALLPLLLADGSGHVSTAAERAQIRRRRQQRHDNHVSRIMGEVARLSQEFFAEESPPSGATPAA